MTRSHLFKAGFGPGIPSLVVICLLFVSIHATSVWGAERTLHHNLHVVLEPAHRTLNVSGEILIDGKGEVTFHLSSRFIFSSLVINGKPATPVRSGDNWFLDLANDRKHVITFSYMGKLEDVPEEPRQFHGYQPMASAQGSYLSPASGWLPTTASTPASYRMDLETPDTYRIVIPGKIEQEGTQDGRYRVRITSNVPLNGIVLLGGPYQIEEVMHGETPVRTYFHPSLSSLSNDYLKKTSRYIGMYEDWIGSFPFSSFHVVSGPFPVGFGFPGLTYIGERVLRLPFILTSSLGHEVLHNWWGNGIEAELDQGNWAEGLTTYMADYTYAEQRSFADARSMRINWLRDYTALPPARDKAVSTFISSGHDRQQVIGYNKVAYIFHMLKSEVGQPAFDAAIRLFWKQHAFGYAGWTDIESAFEKTSGRNLGYFFEQWVHRKGGPVLSLTNVQREEHRITFTVVQSGEPYKLLVPVDIQTDNGPERHDIRLSGSKTDVELSTKGVPTALTIDPDFDVFRRLAISETPPILRDVMLKPGSRTLILSQDSAFRTTAAKLARRLYKGKVREWDSINGNLPRTPLMVLGLSSDVSGFLEKAKIPSPPNFIINRGTARVWATRWTDENGETHPLLVIAADNTEALENLIRPLPHYGRRGYLAFEGAKVIEKGVEAHGKSPLSVSFP